jgi:hypothetical protein
MFILRLFFALVLVVHLVVSDFVAEAAPGKQVEFFAAVLVAAVLFVAEPVAAWEADLFSAAEPVAAWQVDLFFAAAVSVVAAFFAAEPVVV